MGGVERGGNWRNVALGIGGGLLGLGAMGGAYNAYKGAEQAAKTAELVKKSRDAYSSGQWVANAARFL